MEDSIVRQFLDRAKRLGDKIRAVYLFGSRAKGLERPDSDYDLLLVVANDFTLKDKDGLYDGVLDVLLATGRLISLKIFKEEAFKRLQDLNTPFISHVLQEGIQVG